MPASSHAASLAHRPPWVLVSAGFHESGGQSKANAALAEYLLARGTPVHLVGHDIDSRFLNHPKVTAHVIPRPGSRDFLGWLPLKRRGLQVAAEVTALHSRARVVVNGGCCPWSDINWVHCVHRAWDFADYGAPLWFKMKNRLTKWWARRCERIAVRSARLIVANSAQTRDHLIRHLGLEPNRIHVVHLGADPDWTDATAEERSSQRLRLRIPEGRPVVLFVGALSHDHNKGFDTLLATWRSLASTGWDAELLVAGSGNGLNRWRKVVSREPWADRVRFLGFSKELLRLLPAADLLVSPVRYEAYGLNVQEAICRGVPALVSARAGVVERFPPELAEMILPNPEDWRDLAARLRRWRSMIPTWRARFRPLSEELRDETWDRMASRMVELVERGSSESRLRLRGAHYLVSANRE